MAMANPQPTPFVRFSKELFEAFYLNPPGTVAAGALCSLGPALDLGRLREGRDAPEVVRAIADEINMDKSTVHRELPKASFARAASRSGRRGLRHPEGLRPLAQGRRRKPRESSKMTGADRGSGSTSQGAVPTVGTKPVPTVGTNRPTGGDNAVPTVWDAYKE
jgi:hypothetical protein